MAGAFKEFIALEEEGRVADELSTSELIDLARAYSSLSTAYLNLEQGAGAVQAASRAVEVAEEAATRSETAGSGATTGSGAVAGDRSVVGRSEKSTGSRATAGSGAAGTNGAALRALAFHLSYLGSVYLAAGRPGDAVPALERATSLYRELRESGADIDPDLERIAESSLERARRRHHAGPASGLEKS